MPRNGEQGAFRKAGGADIPVALVYPNQYRVGMGNLGFQFAYQYLNQHPYFSAERFFYPDVSGQEKPTKKGPLSEESSRPLNSFPVIAFSVPFENDYPSVPRTLIAAGIPPLQKDRKTSDPLVIAGGVSVSMNPEPLAPFLDLACIGEISDTDETPGVFQALADELMEPARGLADRDGFLRSFREVEGVYVPSAYDFRFDEDGLIREIVPAPGFPGTVQALKRRSPDSRVPVSVLFSPDAEFGESLLVESNRGCGRGCRFCAAGWIHFPVRHRPFRMFQNEVDKAIDDGRTIGLIGSDLAGHPDLEDILTHIVDRGGRFSLSSIRPEGLTPTVIDLLARTGQKTATLAPEAASLRMKRVIGKEISSETFHDLVGNLVTAGIPNVRFYFMVGLPTETDEDVEAIVDFVLKSRKVFLEASRPLGRIGRIGVQLNPFVPKPWTPFQWAAMGTGSVLRRRLGIIRKGLKKEPNLVVRAESVRQALVQGLLSRGDRRISGALVSNAKGDGNWPESLRKEPIDPDFYLTRGRDYDELFPWDVTDHGVSKRALHKIYSKAVGDAPSPK
jgi:radical SAM superfamily enzyme YgiQ (UPF0313 family)